MNRKQRKLRFIRMKNSWRLNPNSQYIYKGNKTFECKPGVLSIMGSLRNGVKLRKFLKPMSY